MHHSTKSLNTLSKLNRNTKKIICSSISGHYSLLVLKTTICTT
uniref:Uncharacterized protein n=1 Tax=Physcomitrium patens TaxID=3218 RepID=A0A2K1IVB5_PHYPA|nr:hypothetical protein PHYPA_025168 [Physcomitrium patens]